MFIVLMHSVGPGTVAFKQYERPPHPSSILYIYRGVCVVVVVVWNGSMS